MRLILDRATGWPLCAMLLLSLTLTSRAAFASDSPPLPEARWRAFQTGTLRADRIQHASLAFTSGLGAGLVTMRPHAAFASGLGLGLAKECVDARSTGFDWIDLAADLAGAGLAAFATRSLTR